MASTESGKVILITGATAGIGRHAALYLAARGHHVIATGRRQAALDELRREAKGRLDIVPLDVTDPASIAACVSAVTALLGGARVDVLVNNAGFAIPAPVAETTDADLRAMFETNFFGLLAVTRAFLPGMMERGRGRIVNVSSVGGRVTFPLFGGYNATKYAVESASDALRRELVAFGIEVVLVEPGPIRSSFAEKSVASVNRYRRDDSPYAAAYARTDAIAASTEARSYDPVHTSRAITQAVESRRPAARYLAPKRMALVIALMRWLPTRLVDRLLARAVGLWPRAIAAATPADAAAGG
jgi:short-subunit dehydrogenase